MSSCSACGSAERRDEAVDEVFNVTAITCWSPVFLQPFALGATSARSAERLRKRCGCWSMNKRFHRDPFLCMCTNMRDRTIAWS